MNEKIKTKYGNDLILKCKAYGITAFLAIGASILLYYLIGNLNDIKKSYGRVNLFVKSDSEIAPHIQKFGITIVEKMPSEYHLKVTDECQAREFLASMMQDNVPLVKFELREPSLHEIFVEKVGDDNEER